MTLKERATSLSDWILRREGCLKTSGLPKLIEKELKKQREIDIERAWKECSLIFHEYGVTKDFEQRFRKALTK